MRNFKRNILRTADETLYCGGSLTINVNDSGYYEVPILVGNGVGDITITLFAGNIPDRFQILWDNNIVADSLFVGNYLGGTAPPNTNPSSYYEGIITSATTLNKFLYNGNTFDPNGTIPVTFTSLDIADSTGDLGTLRGDGDGNTGGQIGVVANYPNGSAKASNGSIKLTFAKSSPYPETISIVGMSADNETGWNILNIECT